MGFENWVRFFVRLFFRQIYPIRIGDVVSRVALRIQIPEHAAYYAAPDCHPHFFIWPCEDNRPEEEENVTVPFCSCGTGREVGGSGFYSFLKPTDVLDQSYLSVASPLIDWTKQELFCGGLNFSHGLFIWRTDSQLNSARASANA
jgi:hypothetical protein